MKFRLLKLKITARDPQKATGPRQRTVTALSWEEAEAKYLNVASTHGGLAVSVLAEWEGGFQIVLGITRIPDREHDMGVGHRVLLLRPSDSFRDFFIQALRCEMLRPTAIEGAMARMIEGYCSLRDGEDPAPTELALGEDGVASDILFESGLTHSQFRVYKGFVRLRTAAFLEFVTRARLARLKGS